MLKNLLKVLGSLFCGYIAYTTLTGEILNYVYFADPLNEMFFCVMGMVMSILLLCTLELKKS